MPPRMAARQAGDPLHEWRVMASLEVLNQEIVSCTRCPRLVAYREEIGRVRRRAYREEQYWSRPVPGFGDIGARLLVVGLAPGAHGANRTGRMFTGDRSGEFLYRALWEAGFANQPHSISSDDGLTLTDAYITAPVRCAPPHNKPAQDEILNCRSYLVTELSLLRRVQVVVTLGGIGLNAYLAVLQAAGKIRARSAFRFGHGAQYLPFRDSPRVLASYHPSQQNTSTGRLTAKMLGDVFLEARRIIEASPEEAPAKPEAD